MQNRESSKNTGVSTPQKAKSNANNERMTIKYNSNLTGRDHSWPSPESRIFVGHVVLTKC